ncbi:hypothetical protein MYCTH_102510 [Thermothelomyces thermophilus ATCC 42464]|uniref:JmjC domain-containing protein n=1 Tax=Thermothelomyces thermophilus (strain ATCC 42464 / BCRC 31852 / DSM 1799) TaxID=573729 RepID=G2QF64_THET4|nr:uncharacterized protein MYCTH_102510 [Thermothelomyces thermophilus ATCC 42464]AEO59093.1 hypothetical protein MYCTH_102510 [Thermothelomyces thermophilus ATCC 42464]
MLHLTTRSYYAPSMRLLAAKRHFSASARRGQALRQRVEEIDFQVTPAQFRRIAATAKDRVNAIVIRHQANPRSSLDPESSFDLAAELSALTRWFVRDEVTKWTCLSSEFRSELHHNVPYELIISKEDGSPFEEDESWIKFRHWISKKQHSPALSYALESWAAHEIQIRRENGRLIKDFMQFSAPLALFDAVLKYNQTRPEGCKPVGRLYVAQMPLTDLPPRLRPDVAAPKLLAAPTTPEVPFVCDIYSSSLWLGLQPTFTPWHRDPNDNLFCQLVGSKTVRLLPPEAGEQLFRKVTTELGKPGASATIRDEEMMNGAERRAWHEAVWGPGAPKSILETTVNARDMLLIPKGWWHSVESTGGQRGDLNVSVNWWFRWRDPSLSSHRPSRKEGISG